MAHVQHRDGWEQQGVAEGDEQEVPIRKEALGEGDRDDLRDAGDGRPDSGLRVVGSDERRIVDYVFFFPCSSYS
jgi:hypothetical protein